MALTNISKPTTSLANITKVSIGETWATWLTSWATETRTWDQLSQLVTNSAKISQYDLWSANSLPWQSPAPWQTITTPIVNTSKPA